MPASMRIAEGVRPYWQVVLLFLAELLEFLCFVGLATLRNALQGLHLAAFYKPALTVGVPVELCRSHGLCLRVHGIVQSPQEILVVRIPCTADGGARLSRIAAARVILPVGLQFRELPLAFDERALRLAHGAAMAALFSLRE